MRIAIVSETYPPEINGVALTVQSLVHGLAGLGHQIELIRPRQGSGIDAREPAGVETREVRGTALPRYPGLRLGLPAGRALRRRWADLPPDALYIATEGPLGWSALSAAHRLGIPCATGFHTRFDTYAGHYGVGFLTPAVLGYLRRFHRRADATLVPTQALAQELQELGVGNVRLLRRAVDTQQFHPGRRDTALRAQWGVGSDTPVMLYVGRIAAEKNLQLAVRTYQAVRQHCPDLRYVWVGDGPARAALQAAHPEFIFAGLQRGEALARHYASADVFAFPSRSETFGNVILEALASGLPVVSYNEAAAREHLTDGVNGFCIETGDEAAFMRSTTMLCSNPALIRHMGRAAHASMASLAPTAVIREFEQLLGSLNREKRDEHPATAVHA
jgi:glycosyltransferase involved in cell wall biosynthesis